MSTTKVHDVKSKSWYASTVTFSELVQRVTLNSDSVDPKVVVVMSVRGQLVEVPISGGVFRSEVLERFVGDKLNERAGDVQTDEIEAIEHHAKQQREQGEVLYLVCDGELAEDSEPLILQL